MWQIPTRRRYGPTKRCEVGLVHVVFFYFTPQHFLKNGVDLHGYFGMIPQSWVRTAPNFLNTTQSTRSSEIFPIFLNSPNPSPGGAKCTIHWWIHYHRSRLRSSKTGVGLKFLEGDSQVVFFCGADAQKTPLHIQV